MTSRAVAIDIGGTKIAAAIVDADGAITGRVQTATPKTGGEDVLAAVVRVAQEALATTSDDVTACGIGSAGVIGPDGNVVSATDLIPGWAGAPLATHVSESLNLPTFVVNDVHATGIGEALAGAAAGADPVLLMAVGTGIGGAVIVGGEVLVGANGVAGSLGHTPVTGTSEDRTCSCGTVNHLEPHASGPGLELSSVSVAGAGDRPSLRNVAAAAREGHADALAVFETGGRLIGQALGVQATIIDPALIVIGGGVSAVTDLLQPGIEQGLTESGFGAVRDVRIVPAKLGSDAALVGAGLHAIRAAKNR